VGRYVCKAIRLNCLGGVTHLGVGGGGRKKARKFAGGLGRGRKKSCPSRRPNKVDKGRTRTKGPNPIGYSRWTGEREGRRGVEEGVEGGV